MRPPSDDSDGTFTEDDQGNWHPVHTTPGGITIAFDHAHSITVESLTDTDRYENAKCTCGWLGRRVLRSSGTATEEGREHLAVVNALDALYRSDTTAEAVTTVTDTSVTTQFILITGNPVDGFTYIGPYATAEEASEEGDNGPLGGEGDWWVAPLQSTEVE